MGAAGWAAQLRSEWCVCVCVCLGLCWGLWRFTAGPGHNQACWCRWWTASFNRFYEFTAGLPLLLAFISLSLETANASKLISSRRADRQTGRQSPRIPVCVHIPPCAHTCTPDSPCAPGVWGSEGRWKAFGSSMWPCIFMGYPPSALIPQLALCLWRWQSKPGPPNWTTVLCKRATPIQKQSLQNALKMH